jgi:CRISP-associated protein Cas1
MIKRTIEISNPSRVSYGMGQLVIEQDGDIAGQSPIEDLGVLILAHPAIAITQAAIAACLEAQCVIVFCDKKFLPVSVLLPLWTNSLHSKIVKDQIALTKPAQKRLWQQVIIGKIESQTRALKTLNLPHDQLKSFAARVKSGDPENIEAQTARVYWAKLFGETFRRNREKPGINMLLNYGYAVMRAAVARALCGSGLNPALGIHHHNQYDALCLADDLVEPLRPAVDLVVYKLAQHDSDAQTLTRQHKTELLNLLNQPFLIQKKSFPLLVALQYYTASFKNALTQPEVRLEIPFS